MVEEDDIVIKIEGDVCPAFLWKPFPPITLTIAGVDRVFDNLEELREVHKLFGLAIKYLEDQ